MIIALEKDNGSLFLFASIAEAEAEFEGIDVENEEYEYCDHTGQRLIGEFIKSSEMEMKHRSYLLELASAGQFCPKAFPDAGILMISANASEANLCKRLWGEVGRG